MKYFVVSDIHGFYDELISSLNEAGYDKNNSNHTLIILGDIFDRGRQPLEILEFVQSIPQSNRILIRGNHEDLFLDLLNKDFPDSYDFYNETVQTFCDIVGYPLEHLMRSYWKRKFDKENIIDNPDETVKYIWKQIIRKINDSPCVSFLKSDEWVNYAEISNYIFTHAFIPLKAEQYDSNWRDYKDEESWRNARWIRAYEGFNKHLFDEEIKKGKILVVGHYKSSFYHNKYGNSEALENNTIYKGENLVVIDTSVMISRKIGVFCFEF